MKLYVMRHARTDHNKNEIINGQSDEQLSSEGRAQLPGLVDQLHSVHLDVIRCSPLIRARDSAQPIADDHGLLVEIEPRFIEVDFGSLTGKPWDSTLPIFGLTSGDLLNAYKYDFTAYGGESSDDVKTRVGDGLADLKNSGHEAGLVVAHGGIMRWIHYLVTGEKIGRSENLSVREYDL